MILLGAIKAIQQFSSKIIGVVRSIAKDYDKIATGKTIQSLETAEEVDIIGGVYQFDLYGDEAFDFIEQGRPPGAKMPPKGALIEWMQARGIPLAAEFPIRRSIARKGIEPVPLLKTSFITVEDRFKNAVEQSTLKELGRNILESIRNGIQFPTVRI